MHRIHINLTRVWFPLSWLRQIGILVLVDWHPDVDFLLTALVNRLGKSKEARMWTSSFLWDEALMSVFISFFDATLV